MDIWKKKKKEKKKPTSTEEFVITGPTNFQVRLFLLGGNFVPTIETLRVLCVLKTGVHVDFSQGTVRGVPKKYANQVHESTSSLSTTLS